MGYIGHLYIGGGIYGMHPMHPMNGAMNIYGDECDIGDRDILGGGGQPRA